MPLQRFKKYYKSGGRVDIRALGSLEMQRKEKVPYSIPPESLELAYTDEQWKDWVKDCIAYFRDGLLDMAMEQAFFLSILDYPRLTQELAKRRYNSDYLMRLITNDAAPKCYFYYAQLFPEIKNADLLNYAKRVVHRLELSKFNTEVHDFTDDGSILRKLKDVGYLKFLNTDQYARLDLSTFWQKVYTCFMDNIEACRVNPEKFDYSTLFQLAAWIRIVYPEHITELGITEDFCKHIRSTEWWPGLYAYFKILARPEIPGLTDPLPKKDDASKFVSAVPPEPLEFTL